MKDNYDELNDTFNTTPSEIEVQPMKSAPLKKKEQPVLNIAEDIEKDYRYTRGQLYSLIEKGQEAINGIMAVSYTHLTLPTILLV